MNLHGMVSGAIGSVNPNIPVTVRVGTGYTTDARGVRVPTYADPVEVMGQVQPMSMRDLMQVDGLNLQGTKRAIYLNGRVDGALRLTKQGGDLIEIATGGVNDGTWLVAMILEQFPDWVKCACTLQMDGS